MFWVWTVSLPVTILNSPKVTQFDQPGFGTGRDIAGIVLWSMGFIMESVSDIQKYRFRTAHGSDGAVCNVGFFSWTRHPNYFGEIIIQFGKYCSFKLAMSMLTVAGIFMIAISPAGERNYSKKDEVGATSKIGKFVELEREGNRKEQQLVCNSDEEGNGKIIVVEDVYGCHISRWTMLTLCARSLEQSCVYIYRSLEAYSCSLRTEAELSTLRWQNLADSDEQESYSLRWKLDLGARKRQAQG